MNNEIGRKLTSLTLLSILLASGVTFAVPGVIPSAEAAHNANLFVSAENSQFSNYFGGPMVVEVVVNDPALSDTDEGKGEPDVTVNGKKVRMLQATDGLWYAYIADRNQAQIADSIQAAGSGLGTDFGEFCTAASGATILGFSTSDTTGIAVPNNAATGGTDGTTTIGTCTANLILDATRENHVVRENKTLTRPTSTVNAGQLGISDSEYWPFIQLYDFNPTGNVVITYNKGGGPQTTTLTFDTMDTFSKVSTDRAVYPTGAEVHINITDGQLNIDPTDEDSWTFGTRSANQTVFYQLFNENGATDADGTGGADNISGFLSQLMFEDNGRVQLNAAAQGVTVAGLEDNDDQVLTAGATASIAAADQPMTFVEQGSNTGIFANYDESDNSNLDILDAATPETKRGKSATFGYNKVSYSVLVGFGFGTLDINVADGEWNSGEEVPVTLVDSDANKNSRADEDLDVFDPNVSLIPSLRIGTPFTLSGSADADFFAGAVTSGTTTAGLDSIGIAGTNLVVGGNNATITVNSFSDRGIVNPSGTTSFTWGNGTGTNALLLIDLGRDVDDLQDTINNPVGSASTKFRGLNMFNFDLRSLDQDTTSTITGVRSYLVVNRTGTGDTGFSNAAFDTGNNAGLVAISLGNTTGFSGLLNLNKTTDAGTVDSTIISNNLFSTSNSDTDDIALAFILVSTTGISIDADDKPIVADFFSFGINGDGFKTTDRVNNAIYRFELEESGDNTSTFVGSAEFTMLNQLNIFDDSVYEALRTVDDEVTFIVQEDLTDEDAPRVNYLDKGADGVSTQIADQSDADTHSAVVSFDKNTYKVADTVTVTLEDADLNVDSDLIDIYTTVDDDIAPIDVADNTVGVLGSGTYSDGSSFGRLLDITFDDNRWTDISGCAPTSADKALSDSGFTLVETGTETGVFKGDFQIPGDYCAPSATSPTSVTGLDLEVNYVDFRDASGETLEVGDGAGIRANTGSISLDRTVYPVPFGKTADFSATTGTSPGGRSLFPVHVTGITGSIGAAETIGEGDLAIHVRVNDPDFDLSASGEDKIASDRSSQATGPVKISVSRGTDKVVLAYAGGPAAQLGKIDVGDNAATSTRELGPITETAPNSGIFELDMTVLYTDGPASTSCPPTVTFTGTNGSATGSEAVRFDAVSTTGDYCILQGDIITVEYTDPTDASGDVNSVTDSATFDLRNGVLQSDKSVYIIGSDMIMTLIEPDLDLDSDAAESYDLDLIEWDSDAATVTMGNLGANSAAFDPEPSDFRETGDSTGIFQIVIEIPNTLSSELLDRGEEIQLEYTDWGPSGADFVGDEDEDINLTIYTSNFGATVELDQKVYTWTDKVFITIVAPDHNFDSNLIDEVGDTDADKITVATRGQKLDKYKLVETGTDTGIFTGEVILTGFTSQDADGDGTTGDAPGTGPTGSGPTDGFIPADDDDGLTVSFEFTEDETVVGSALIRWNIGEVQFLEASYPATGQGVVRVVDPDMNINPESVDTFDVDAWSDSDAGGIDLTVTETNEATGIFEGTVFFTVTDESSGHRLRVAEGDTVTAEYEDNTLPSPYTTADELEITATTFIGSIVPPLERAPASNPRIVDAFGNELDEVGVDQQVQITADLANGQDRDQSFAYLVQIQDEDGVTVSLSWITGSLAPGQSLNPAQSWTPTSPGTYNVQIFVWESVDNPDALSPPVSTTITVS